MADQHEVTIALVYGDTGVAFERDAKRPYSERPKVSLMVAESSSLAEILADATSMFERSYPGDYTDAGRTIDFYRGDPSEGVRLALPTTKTVTITSPDGLAVWHVPLHEASLGDLILADRRKVLAGDPRRPYLLVDPSWKMGGPSPGGWDAFIDIWTLLLALRGSWDLVRATVRVSRKGLEFLNRAADAWERHRNAALYTRQLFESRGASIMDVIETARAAATYQIADLMAWTGIDDPQIAVDVAGWAGYELGSDSQTFSLSVEEEMVELTRDLPINLTTYPIEPERDDSLREVAAALGELLRTTNLADAHELGGTDET